MDGVRRLRTRAGWLAALTVLGALVALGLGARHTPTYSATAQVFVAVDPTSTDAHGVDGDDVVQERADAYAGAATSPEVLRAVVTRLNLPETWTALSGQVDAEHADGTLVVDVTATTASPVAARTIADAVADQLCATAGRLEPATAAGGTLVKLSVTTPATTPSAPDGLGTLPTGLLGGALGLGAGLLVLVVRRRRDPTVRGRRDAVAVTTAPVLGEIPLVRGVGRPRTPGSDPAPSGLDAATDTVALATGDLAAGVRGLPVDVAVRILVVTSADEGEGKSSVAAHLAHALAATGERVVLVDADLRRPRQHEVWGTGIGPGLVDVLTGGTDPGSCLVTVEPAATDGAGSLALLPAGAASARSTDLVGTHRMSQLLRTLGSQAYLVVVDAPPLLPVVDGAVLARMADGALLVARAHRTRRDHLAGAAELLRTSGAGLLGVVVNATTAGRPGTALATSGPVLPALPPRVRPSTTRHHRASQPAGS